MGKRRSRFDEGFRAQAVELVGRSSRPRYQVAAELGVSDTTLGKWMNEKNDSDVEVPLMYLSGVSLSSYVARSESGWSSGRY